MNKLTKDEIAQSNWDAWVARRKFQLIEGDNTADPELNELAKRMRKLFLVIEGGNND